MKGQDEGQRQGWMWHQAPPTSRIDVVCLRICIRVQRSRECGVSSVANFTSTARVGSQASSANLT